jgi:transcriptional regulator GlxA family with amidase domain
MGSGELARKKRKSKEAARVMLEQGHDSIDDVARESGFTSRDHMRRAFLRAYGAPPRALRGPAHV